MRALTAVGFLVVVATSASACAGRALEPGSEPGPGPGGQVVCLQSSTMPCVCPGGAESVRYCSLDGTGYDGCLCPLAGDGGTPPFDRPVPRDVRPPLDRPAPPDVIILVDGPPCCGTPDAPPPPPDVIAPGAQLSYRFSSLQFEAPGPQEHSSFANLANQLFPIAISGGVFGDPLQLLVTFSDVTPGSSGVIATFCQGQTFADGTVGCRPMSEPMQTTASIDNGGNVVTDPLDFSFQISFPGGSIPFTLRDLVLGGLLDPYADNGVGQPPGDLFNGQFKGALGVRDLCGVTLQNPLLGGLCNGPTTVNLLDMVDGPENLCGQDGSADLNACTASTDAATHNPPSGGRFQTFGSFDLTGIR
jgi:hypothetical protein